MKACSIVICSVFLVASHGFAEIKIADLTPTNVMGRLGQPLGTRLMVEGTGAGSGTATNVLLVSEVNGKKLEPPVSIQTRISFVETRISIGPRLNAEAGVRYRLEGYESGEFAGPVDWIDIDPFTKSPFQFQNFYEIARVVDSSGKAGSNYFALRFPDKKHLSARDLYERQNVTAMRDAIGSFVTLDVIVTIEGKTSTVVDIVLPKGVAKSSERIIARLVSATSEASSLRLAQRLRIEGILVAEGYGSFTIYLIQAQPTNEQDSDKH